MRKIIDLCVILCLGVWYIISNVKIQVTVSELFMVIQFTCEILRIVLSVASFILVYNHMNTNINNKANYIAGVVLINCILLLVGLKCYLSPVLPERYGEYIFYKFIVECFQISIPIIGLKYIDETTQLKKWFIGQLILVCIVTIFILNQWSPISYLFNYKEVQIISRVLLSSIIIILLIDCYKFSQRMFVFNSRTFTRLLWIKLLISGLEIFKTVGDVYWISLVQYMLQIIFMMFIVIYIDEFTIGHAWEMIEYGVKNGNYKIAMGRDEQSNLVMTGQEIQYYIGEIVEKVDRLEKKIKDRDKKYLEKVKSNSNRLLFLSKHILQANEYENNTMQLTFESIDLGEYVANIVSSIEPYVQQKEIKLEYTLSKKAIWAEVDKQAIERILLNLISNAVKYNKKGGRIQVVLSEKKKNAYLCIKDSGIGISSTELECIFEKFRRIESKDTYLQEGSGLGLSIVKSLVELHKGHIRIASSEGKGTLISIELPLVQFKEK
ncbi:MAG: HAMP domain-containing histidine kinase [Cellulosilyticum sp.]|nr:HAMP domain-containing histidine kinase [Cellulosilyticum sp.]